MISTRAIITATRRFWAAPPLGFPPVEQREKSGDERRDQSRNGLARDDGEGGMPLRLTVPTQPPSVGSQERSDREASRDRREGSGERRSSDLLPWTHARGDIAAELLGARRQQLA